MINVGNISADQGAKLRENLKSMWNAYFAPADNDKDGKITCAELISYFKQVSKYTTNSEFSFRLFNNFVSPQRQSEMSRRKRHFAKLSHSFSTPSTRTRVAVSRRPSSQTTSRVWTLTTRRSFMRYSLRWIPTPTRVLAKMVNKNHNINW